MNVMLGVAFAALIIGAALVQFWPLIATLSGGSAAFLGALVGAAAGLGAILGGALYNAKLNRDRDDRLRAEERKTVAVEVQADMLMLLIYAKTGEEVIRGLRAEGSDLDVGNLVSLEPPHGLSLQDMAGRFGLLGPKLCLDVVVPYIWVSTIRQRFTAWRGRGDSARVSVAALGAHQSNFASLISSCQDTIDSLEAVTGQKVPPREPISLPR